MTVPSKYEKGDEVRCSGVFTNLSDVAIDPTAVLFEVKSPGGVTTSYTYGVDAELVKNSTGNYHVLVDGNEVGRWFYRFHSTGNGQAADEGEFVIKTTQF